MSALFDLFSIDPGDFLAKPGTFGVHRIGGTFMSLETPYKRHGLSDFRNDPVTEGVERLHEKCSYCGTRATIGTVECQTCGAPS